MTHEFDPDHKNQYHHSLDEDRSKPDGAQRHCDKVTCGTIVKKCVRTERCNNAHLHEQYAQWAKRCIDCLEEKFGKCCGCVGEYHLMIVTLSSLVRLKFDDELKFTLV